MNERFLLEAIHLADHSVESGEGGPFGAIVVRSSEIIGRGTNRVTATHDPTAHAEITAIREACSRLGTFRLDGCELFTNCEPCPMCLAAIYWSHIAKVTFANTRLQAAEIGFDDAMIYDEVGKRFAERRIRFVHQPHVEAARAFEIWRTDPKKNPY